MAAACVDLRKAASWAAVGADIGGGKRAEWQAGRRRSWDELGLRKKDLAVERVDGLARTKDRVGGGDERPSSCGRPVSSRAADDHLDLVQLTVARTDELLVTDTDWTLVVQSMLGLVARQAGRRGGWPALDLVGTYDGEFPPSSRLQKFFLGSVSCSPLSRRTLC